MRPTNVAILVGLVVCIVMVPLERTRSREPARNGASQWRLDSRFRSHGSCIRTAINLGSAFASGYSWWVPEVYGEGGKTFSAAYLFGPTMPRNPHGNVMVYVTTLLGPRRDSSAIGRVRGYFLYPFAAAVFAIVGFVAILRAREKPAARRLMWFGLGYLGALTGTLLLLHFHRCRIHSAGRHSYCSSRRARARRAANRWMRDVLRNQNRNARQARRRGGRDRARCCCS